MGAALRVDPAFLGSMDRIAMAWSHASSITRRGLLAAVATSVLLAAGTSTTWSVRVALAMCGSLIAVAALVDVHEHKLPNRVVLVAALAAIAGAVGTLQATTVLRSLAGCLLAGGAMGVVRLRRGVGMGDVKVAGVVGLSVGCLDLRAALSAIAVAALAAAMFGVLARRARVALGPALWLGWAVSVGIWEAGWW